MTIDDVLDQVLSNPKYNSLTGRTPDIKEILTGVLTSLYEKYIYPILNAIRFPKINTPFTDPGLLRNIFIAVGIFILLIIIYFLYSHIKNRRKKANSMDEIFDALSKKTITYEMLLEEALELSKKDRYRDAVRLEYISLLWVLNKHNIIFLKDAKTNTQIKREVLTNAEALYEDFGSVVNTFHYTWFGYKLLTLEQYNNNRETILRLIQASALHERIA